MHDTFLNENIYTTIVNICKQSSITRVNNLIVTVHTDSHITKESLREYFQDRSNTLVGVWTNIVVKHREIEKLTAVLDHIDGETVND
ncbi:MAG TPA: hypothetical protein VFD52_04110 [Clostridia bacterium]|nr:hypothetical protein [Clostridia bacterium]